jgi:AcrR family transcriptional regulator
MEAGVREQLLDTALDLFYAQGYESTSVNAIIGAVGVSKGAFYHYFSSKEEVLASICRGHLEGQLRIVAAHAKDPALSASAKLLGIMVQLYMLRTRDVNYAKTYTVLQHNFTVKEVQAAVRQSNEDAGLLYKDIILQGIREGVFDTPYPAEMAELYVQLINIFRRSLMAKGTDATVFIQKVRFYEDSMCRLLGADPATLPLTETLVQLMRGGRANA